MIKKFQRLVSQYAKATHLRIAMADISFTFPESCIYPCLSVRIEGFGLINPLEGRTVATLPEVHLALYQGASIIYHEAVVIEDFDGETYFCRDHLFRLFTLRNDAKKNDQELLQLLYKTYTNSLYGKLAQGIRERKMYNTREGNTKRLPKSAITNAFYASMTTGLIRAALSSILVALDELIKEGHDYKIVSATTDGLLYGVGEAKLSVADTLEMGKLSEKYSSIAEALECGFKKFRPFHDIDPVLNKRLLKFPSLRLLEISHEAWEDPEYIEVKHVANQILNVKTRGQVGLYVADGKSICTILAKAGHKVGGSKDDQAQWMIDHYEDDEISKYEFQRLSSIQDVISDTNPIDDLVSVTEKRKISLDYDYKRHPVNATDTAPHKDVNQFRKYRQSVDYLRRLNQRGSIDAVDYKFRLAKQNVRKTGSNSEFCIRHILRALVHGVKPFERPTLSYARLAILLQEYKVTLSKLKHAKDATFTPNMISDTVGNRAFIRAVLKKLGYKTETNFKEFLELLLHKKISNPEDVQYLD